MKYLVIVESPAKAKKIAGFLGKDYIVQASFGHFRDLESGNGKLGITDDLNPQYEIKNAKILNMLKKSKKECDEVIIASDKDREGEAIGWHLCEALKLNVDKTKRIEFHEITASAIKNAIKNPGLLDMNMVYSQQCRRMLDRLVGFKISPILVKHIQNGTSAGRVQSVVLKILVEKEEEIKNFKGKTYWTVNGDFERMKQEDKGKIIFTLLNKKYETKDEINTFLKHCKTAIFTAGTKTIEDKYKKPSAPFITSQLLQECNSRFKMSAKRVMGIAQNLYQDGHITYHRTDSVEISKEFQAKIKSFVKDNYGDNYFKARKFKTDTKCAQEAHECIRPTHIEKRNMGKTSDEKRVYELIWKRTVASQMSEAHFKEIALEVLVSKRKEKFLGKAEEMIFDGFLKVYEVHKDENKEELVKGNIFAFLNKIEKDEPLSYVNIFGQEKLTSPPSHYSEATLIKKLKDLGIGRPSTYSSIMEILFERGYAERDTRNGVKVKLVEITLQKNKITEKEKEKETGKEINKIFIKDLGELVNTFMLKNFSVIMDTKYTSQMEDYLDEIANGKLHWKNTLKHFYEQFSPQVIALKAVKVEEKAGKILQNENILGKYEEKTILTRISKNGPVIQWGKPDEVNNIKEIVYVGIAKKSELEKITLEGAISKIVNRLPKNIGVEGNPMILNKGKYGFYVKFEDENHSLKDFANPESAEFDEVVKFIKEQKEKKKENGEGEKKSGVVKEFKKLGVKAIQGKFGPCLLYKKSFHKISTDTILEDLTETDVKTLLQI